MVAKRESWSPAWREAFLFASGALAFRLIFMAALQPVIDSPDAVHYLGLAKHYVHGDWLTVGERIPPLYPALCALAYGVFGDLEFSGRAVSLVMSALVVAPLYLLSFELHGRRTARLVALLVCLWPWLVDYGSRITTEATAIALWFLAVWSLVRAVRDGGMWQALAPMCFFGLFLARPEGLLLWAAAPVGALTLCTGRLRARALRLIPFVAISVLLMACFVGYMRAATGAMAISYRVTDPSEAMHHAFILQGKQLLRAGRRILFDVLPVMVGPYLLVFAGAGLFQPGNGEHRRDLPLEAYVLYFAVAQLAAAVLSTMDAPRYIMAVTIVVALWSARGMVIVADQAAGLERGRWLRWLPAGVMIALMITATVTAVLREHVGSIGYMPREYKAAGLWMREHLEPGLIFARKPEIGFYADMPSTGPAADESLEQSIDRARAAGARYVVVDERYTVNMVPAWRPLLDPGNAPPDLRLLQADLSPYRDARIIVYELLPESGGAGAS